MLHKFYNGGVILNKFDTMDNLHYSFGAILVIANKIDTLLERELKVFGITSKQWFLSVVLDSLFDEPPTIKEAAREMGSSHQNVKQVALKLEQKGLLSLEKDKKDARVTRLKLTDKCYEFWAGTQSKAIAFTHALYKGIGEDELSSARTVLERMLANLSEME
jgi:DNA-binding MarR family transcriptional regulator